MKILTIRGRPGRTTALILSWLLFITGIMLYFRTSTERHRENPDDRVTPTLAQMGQAFLDAALKPAGDDQGPDEAAPRSLTARFMSSMLWKDTEATGRRFFYSMALLIPMVLVGLHMAVFPYAGAFLLRFILFFDKIIALSLLSDVCSSPSASVSCPGDAHRHRSRADYHLGQL